MLGLKGIPAAAGGVERHVEQLAPLLVRRGIAVTAYCRRWYSPQSGPLLGVQRAFAPSIRTKHLDAITHTLCAALAALAADHELLHFHAIGPASLSFLPRLAGRRAVVTIHGLDYNRAKWGGFARWSLRQAERVLATSANKIIVVSRGLERHFAQRVGARCVYIPNGVPAPRPLPPKLISERWGLEREGYVLSLGRLVAEKRVQDTIEAFKRLEVGHRLVVAGAADYGDEYAARLRRAAQGDARIVFTGAVAGDELNELLSNAAAFVQASELEGLPIALLEALSYGRPVAASDIGEHLEVLQGAAGGAVGLTYPMGDTAALAERLALLLGDRKAALELGAAGAAHVAGRYDWESAAERTLEVYRELERRA